MNHFYFISQNNYLICDLENCNESLNTFDIKLFDLANNEKLLDLLGLYYMQGNYGARYTYESRAKWFCGYLSAFSIPNDKEQYEKSITNPMVRLLINETELLLKVKAVI